MIEYRCPDHLTVDELLSICERSGLRRPVDRDRLAKMIAHANLIATARVDGRLVGFARSLTDFAFCCYVSDLGVDREYQRRGVGRELLRVTRERAGPESNLLLLAAPTAVDYYPHIGFQRVDNGFILPRVR